MIIRVGSKNPVKVEAVREIIADYPFLAGAEAIGVEVDSGVGNQPTSLDAAILGAQNRARAAFQNCDVSIGLESGIMPVPHSRTGYMDFTACVIFDGEKMCLGLSSCFEYPKEVTRLLIEENTEASNAFRAAGLTEHERIGYAEGAIGILTNGRLLRKEYTKQAIRNALIQLEHPEWY
ncbi:MAG: inosine/xanthosine triphosphatase [Patescibacteria group bacterium]